MGWINYDELKAMDKFYKQKELEWKEKYGFSHNSIGDYFKIEYTSVINDRKIIFYTAKDEKTKLQTIKR